MRDQFGQLEQFDAGLARLVKFNETMPYDVFVSKFECDKRTTPEGAKDLTLVTGIFLTKVVECMLARYSKGDELSLIVEDHVPELLKRLKFVSKILSGGHPAKHIFTIEDQESHPHRINTIFCMLAWLICSGCDRKDLAEVIPFLGKSGESPLVDAVCGFYQAGREMAVSSGDQSPFALLDKLLEVEPRQRAEIIHLYLDEWPKTVDAVGSASVSISLQGGNVKIRNRDDLVRCIGPLYLGYWAWEVAVAVKFFHIEDSSFKDHEFYPYDLVHFAPQLENSAYIESFDSGSSATTSIVIRELAQKRNDLIVEIENQNEEVARLLEQDCDTLHRKKFYHAYHFADDGKPSAASLDPILDSDIRYSGYFLSDKDEVAEDRGGIVYAMAVDAEFSPRHRDMVMHELLDELGQSEIRPFMEEAYLQVSGDQNEFEYLYCSRHKEGQVPPMMVLRYRKKLDEMQLCIDCVVRDERIKVSDVFSHWEWLIDTYRKHER